MADIRFHNSLIMMRADGAQEGVEKHAVEQAVQKWPYARRAKTESRGVYRNTLSDAGCSATQQVAVLEARLHGGASR